MVWCWRLSRDSFFTILPFQEHAPVARQSYLSPRDSELRLKFTALHVHTCMRTPTHMFAHAHSHTCKQGRILVALIITGTQFHCMAKIKSVDFALSVRLLTNVQAPDTTPGPSSAIPAHNQFPRRQFPARETLNNALTEKPCRLELYDAHA